MDTARRRRRGAPTCLISLLALTLVIAFGADGSATGSGEVSDLQTSFAGRVAPSRLPIRPAAPVRLTLAEEVEVLSGAHPPALEELDLDLDRHLGLSVKGVPVCPGPLNESGPRTGTPAICGDSKVGSGSIEVEVAFPGQPPARTSGHVIVYNAGAGDGRAKLWVYAYISAPVTGAILMPLALHRERNGEYGWSGTLEVPKIANGAGSITALGFRIRKGIFSAACPSGKLRARSVAHFGDGTAAVSPFLQRCRTVSD